MVDTHPGGGERLKDYWTHGEGAAKIRWGEGGDYDRCVREVGQEVAGKTGIDVHGYCANLHHRALGYWPATHKKMLKGAAWAVWDEPTMAAFEEKLHPRGFHGRWTHVGKSDFTFDGPAGGGGHTRAIMQVADIVEHSPGNKDTATAIRRSAKAMYRRDMPSAHRHLDSAAYLDGTTGGQWRPDIEAIRRSYANVPKGALPLETKPMVPESLSYIGQRRRRLSSPGLVGAEAEPPSGLGQVPALVTIPGVDILAAGQWNLVSGKQEFTPKDLAAAVAAVGCPSVRDPIIKIGHSDPGFDGEPAVGRVRNMRLAQEGNKITGDLAGMPGWLGAVAASAYPSRSIEGTYNFQCQTGHMHPFVITALALLGVTPPGVGVLSGLPNVAALYGGEAAAGPQLKRWAFAPGSGGEMTQIRAGVVSEADVRRAYYDRPDTDATLWITELRMDPEELIVAAEATGKVYRVPWSIHEGEIKFGEPREVQVTYADVMAMRGTTGTALTFASAADSRDIPDPLPEPEPGDGNADPDPDVVAAWDAGAAVAAMGNDPSASQIRAMFALPAGSKSDSSLPHHNVSGGQVGGANTDACSAAIGAINGARGGLKGQGGDALRRAYGHLAAHLRAAGQTPPPLKLSASAEAGIKVDAAGRHGAFSGTHSHQHAAMGHQGGDATHDHSHTHSGSGSHAHVHAAAGGAQGGEVQFTDEQLAALRSALGLADDAELDEETLVSAAGALREQADAQQPVAAGAGDLPHNVITVDRGAWDRLNQRVVAGEQARSQQLRDQRDTVIAGAIREGKFSVADRDTWVASWNAAPDQTRDVIARLAKNVVPVGDLGAPGNPEDGMGGFEEYDRLFPEEYRAASTRPGT